MASYEVKVTVSSPFRDNLISLLSQRGSLGFIENDDDLFAYFPEQADINSIGTELNSLRAVLAAADVSYHLQFSITLMPDQDWNESWKKQFTLLDIGENFTILPPWERPRPERINVIIDPGMAFGTGHHETTRSCLVLMEKHFDRVGRDRFLDIGTGTALLAIAASKLGFREVIAVDTDPLATEAARANARLNQAVNVEVREGSIEAVSGSYDCVVANLISGMLILLAPDIASRLKPGGIAILSGMLAEQTDEVVPVMNNNGLVMIEIFPDDKWISLVVSRTESTI